MACPAAIYLVDGQTKREFWTNFAGKSPPRRPTSPAGLLILDSHLVNGSEGDPRPSAPAPFSSHKFGRRGDSGLLHFIHCFRHFRAILLRRSCVDGDDEVEIVDVWG